METVHTRNGSSPRRPGLRKGSRSFTGSLEAEVKGRVRWRKKNGAWEVNAAPASPAPPSLPRYYHTLFTHSLPKALWTLADEAPTCVDVLMNFLVAAVTKLPPIKVPHATRHGETSPPLVRNQGDWWHWEGTGEGIPLV